MEESIEEELVNQAIEYVRPAKIPISLRVRVIWSESSRAHFW